MNIENGKDKLKQITDQFGEKQTFSPSYEIVLPEGYNNLNWVEKIKDAESLRIQNCQQITDFAPLEQLDNLTQLYLLDAEKFNSKSFSTLGKITKIDTLSILGAQQVKELKNIKQMQSLNYLYLQTLNCENFEEIGELQELSTLLIIANKIENIDFIKKMKKLRHLEIRPAPIKDGSALKDFNNNVGYSEKGSLDICLDADTFLPPYLYNFKNITLRNYYNDSVLNIDHLNSFSSIENITIVGCINNQLLKAIKETEKSFKEINFVYFDVKELKDIPDSVTELRENEIYITKYTKALEQLDLKILDKIENLTKVSFINHDYLLNQEEEDYLTTPVKPKIPEALTLQSLSYDVFSEGRQIYLSKKTFEKYLTKDGKKLRIEEANIKALDYIDQYPSIEEVDISPWAKDKSIKPLLSLSNLTSLCLANKKSSLFTELPLFEDKIKELIIINDSESIFDLDYIKNFKQIEKLDIRTDSLDYIENISLISNLKNLKTLLFEDWDVTDFDFKNQLPLLTSLKANLSWAENSLHNLSNLNTLMLDAYNENIFFDFKYLSPLRKLKSLTVSAGFLLSRPKNIEYLSELTSIEELCFVDIDGIEITQEDINLNFIAELKNLKIIRTDTSFLDFPFTKLEGLDNLETVDFGYGFPDTETIKTLLKLKSLKEIISIDDYFWEVHPNPYLSFKELLMKNVTVTINEIKYSQLPLAQYSDSLEEDYGILYQTKDCDPSSTTTLDINLYGQDENYNEYSIGNLNILKHFKNLKELTIKDPYTDFDWGEQKPLDIISIINLQALEKIKLDSILIQDLNFIASMTQLKELILYYSMLAEDQDINKADISSLTRLKVDGEECWNSVSDLLSKFPHLEEISINVDEGENIDEKIFLQCPKLKKIHCYQLSGFHENFGMEELASLENLEEISALRLMDQGGITKFKKIKKIDSLYIDEVLDIPAFVDCLQSIEVRMLGIGSLEGLPEEYFLLGKLNQSLKNIYIRGGNINEISDLSFFSNLKNLESLKLEYIDDWQKPVDFSHLSKLEHLRELHLDGYYKSENINSINELKGFPSLTTLTIDLLNDLSKIKHLPALMSLKLSNPINIGMISSSVPQLERLEFYANYISDLQPLANLQSLKFLDISRVHKISDFNPIGHLRFLRRLKLDTCDLMTSIKFLEKLKQLVYIEICSRNLEENNKDNKKRLLDLSPLNESRNVVKNLKLEFINTSVDLNSLPSMLALEEISLGIFSSIENIEALSKQTNLRKIEFENINTPIDLKIFSSMSNLQSLNFRGCKNIINPNYFENNDAVKVSIEKSHVKIYEESKGKPFDEQHIMQMETEWVRDKIVTKGKDTSYPHLFEILKEKNNFEHFIKFLSSLAKNLGQAKTSIEQKCRIISAMYQYLSMGVVMRELAIHYEENTRQHLIQEFFSHYPFINSTNTFLSGQCCFLINECLWDLSSLVGLRGGFFENEKIDYSALYRNAMTLYRIYMLGKFEINIHRSKNKNLINEQAKRLRNFDLNVFEHHFKTYANNFENLVSNIANNDWNSTEINFDSVSMPDELTSFFILYEDIFQEQSGLLWLEKNEWCSSNFNLMQETLSIADNIKSQGYSPNKYEFFIKLDAYLGEKFPEQFPEKRLKQGDDMVDPSELFDENHNWRTIPDFTIDLNLKNHNPILELLDCSILEDLNPIEKLPHLEELRIYSCWALKDIDPLKALTNLKHLELIESHSLTNITSLQYMKNLEYLHIYGADKLVNLKPLAKCINLKYLFLYGCESIKDFSPLKDLINLEVVVIPNCQKTLPDLSSLFNLPNLWQISLENCEDGIDLSILKQCKKVSSLVIGYSKSLSKIPKLDFFENLTSLNVNYAPNIKDLSNLKELKTLHHLKFLRSCWYVDNINDLKGLRNLITLSLEDFHHLEDIEAVKFMKELTELNLAMCLNLKNIPSTLDQRIIKEKPYSIDIEPLIANLDTSENPNMKKIGELNLPSGRLLIRDFTYSGHWYSYYSRDETASRIPSTVDFPKNSNINIYVEFSKEKAALAIVAEMISFKKTKHTKRRFAGYVALDAHGLIIIQDEKAMVEDKKDIKYQQHIEEMSLKHEGERTFLPEISQLGLLVNNSYGSYYFPIFIEYNAQGLSRALVDLDPLKVRRSLGKRGVVPESSKKFQDYLYNVVNEMEDPEGPFLLMTPPEPLNEKYPDHRIKRWEMFLMAKGLFFDKTKMPEGMEEHDPYDKPIDGWLGTMYQRGEATRRRKDNGQIELFGDQEIAKRLFTKNSDNQSTN